MVRRQQINTITNQGIKNWNRDALIPDSVFVPYLPRQGGVIKSSDFNVLFRLLQTGVNALNLHIFRSFIFNLTTTNVAVTNPTDESLSGGATFQDVINKENKIRIVQNTTNINTNTQDIAQNTADIEDLQDANEQNVLGSVLYYNGTDTIGTEVRNQNSITAENLGFYLTFYKNRNETSGTNYLNGDIRYFIQLGSVNGAVSYCQSFNSGVWVAIDCPYNDSRSIVIKKTLDSALNNKVDSLRLNESLNQQGEFSYTENASPFVKKTDLSTEDYTELRILTDGAHLIKNNTTYIAETADEIVVKDLLDNTIAPINQDITSIENVNDNQNMRLGLIEQTLALAASDFGYLKQTTSVQATTTNKYITSSFVSGFEFSSSHITYDNTTDPTVGKFTLTRNAKVIFDFVGNVSRDATDTLTLIYEIWDLDNSTVLIQDTTTFDFTAQSTIFNQGGIISYSFQDIDGTNITERNFAVRFRVSAGTLTATQFKIPINVIYTNSTDTSEILTFEDIQNDTNVAGENGQAVINNLNSQIVVNTTSIGNLITEKADLDYVNTELDTKLTRQQTISNNESKFGYTDGANSPYIEKHDLTTDKTTRLLVFANQNPVIQTLEGTTETSGTYEPTAVNELIIKNDLDKTETRITNQIIPLQEQVIENTTDITLNTSSINTLNNLITQSFTDSGVYTSPSGILNSESGEVRVVLTAVTPLDPTYVSVSVDPNENLFVNNFDGTINFIVQFDGIQNDDVQKTLVLKVYDNTTDTVIKSFTKVIPVGAYITTNVFGVLEVLKDEQVYFTYSISDGAGNLTIANDIIYNIEIQSTTNLTAVKTSALIVDKSDPDLANEGANTDLNQIYTNKDDIITNTNNITTNTANISSLTSRVSVNEINIADKVDVYQTSGNTTTQINNSGSSIGLRTTESEENTVIQLAVTNDRIWYHRNGTTATPTNPDEIVTKKYVDDQIDKLTAEVELFSGDSNVEITLSEPYYNFREIIVVMYNTQISSGLFSGRHMLSVPTSIISSGPVNNRNNTFTGMWPFSTSGTITNSRGLGFTFTGDSTIRPLISSSEEHILKVIGRGRLSLTEIALRK